jgi:dolichol-phosphate mannosyltransferase
MDKISVIVPVFNDSEVIKSLYERLEPILVKFTDYEIIFVDDCSSDNTFDVLLKLQELYNKIRIIKLSSNFGQPGAIAAGIDNSSGDLLVVMDSDLQDRPEDIPLLINTMIERKVLMAVARTKGSKMTFRGSAGKLFHFLSNCLTHIEHDVDLRVFRVIDREALKLLEDYPVKKGTILSLLHRAGIPFAVVDLTKDQRYAGKSGYNISKLMKLAFQHFKDHFKLVSLRKYPGKPERRYQIGWIFDKRNKYV